MFGLKFPSLAKKQPEGEIMTARLNARVQPMHRGEFF